MWNMWTKSVLLVHIITRNQGLALDAGITSITCEDAFSNYKSLTSIDISDTVTMIGRYAFKDCSSLTSLDIPNSVTTVENAAFEG